jgi:hypothetical protein
VQPKTPARKTNNSGTSSKVAKPGSTTPGRKSKKREGQDQVLHIDDMLRPLAERDTPPDEDEINELAKTMARHLLTCEPCQGTLSAIIARLTEQAAEGSDERARGAQLLQRFQAVLVKARVRAQLGPYAATLYLQGEDAARKEYPEVAAHLEECEACRREVARRVDDMNADVATALQETRVTKEQPTAAHEVQRPTGFKSTKRDAVKGRNETQDQEP